MHGQKKRRKRTLAGTIEVEGTDLIWQLISEPQYSKEHGYQGLSISVRTKDEAHRELILQYPYPKAKTGRHLPLPQRPNVTARSIEIEVRRAISAGWEPTSRGQAFVFLTF